MITITAKIAVKALAATLQGSTFSDLASICVLKVSYKSITSSSYP
jgi:hypothetical protein